MRRHRRYSYLPSSYPSVYFSCPSCRASHRVGSVLSLVSDFGHFPATRLALATPAAFLGLNLLHSNGPFAVRTMRAMRPFVVCFSMVRLSCVGFACFFVFPSLHLNISFLLIHYNTLYSS